MEEQESAELRERSDHEWRKVIWASLLCVAAMCAVVLAVLLVSGYLVHDAQDTVATLIDENRDLRSKSDCLVRIDNYAQQFADRRDAIVSEALVDYATAGRPSGLADRAEAVRKINEQIRLAGELRNRSPQICTDDPDYRPPG